ncbi:MAG: hypothetical protein IT165_28625 [Bryobacterales bacterium]|nr:hypothetical protein [Bryobacterales bacterium]
MTPRQWWRARLRWAVLEEGYGIYLWRESEYLFLSENWETAFQQALQLGRQGESLAGGDEGVPWIRTCLAQIVYLDEEDPTTTAFGVFLGDRRATEPIAFDHDFRPHATVPPARF